VRSVMLSDQVSSAAQLAHFAHAVSHHLIDGVGFNLYGSTDKNPSNGSYMATYYFVFFFVRMFPVARYRVISTGGGCRFLGKGPLRAFDKWHIAISVGLVGWLINNW
jgi:hypothetical protein